MGETDLMRCGVDRGGAGLAHDRGVVQMTHRGHVQMVLELRPARELKRGQCQSRVARRFARHGGLREDRV